MRVILEGQDQKLLEALAAAGITVVACDLSPYLAAYKATLDKPVDELRLSVGPANCLRNANIKYVGELVQKTESYLLKGKNFGRKSLHEVKDALRHLGLTLGVRLDGWTPPNDPK